MCMSGIEAQMENNAKIRKVLLRNPGVPIGVHDSKARQAHVQIQPPNFHSGRVGPHHD